ncbi:MAG: hypothetical protein Q4G54_11310, partial [Pelistega sp.]|nr:hypothetical protein [Pelistega sp.]
MSDIFQSNAYIYILIALVVLAIVFHWVIWVYVIRPRLQKHQEQLRQTLDKLEREQAPQVSTATTSAATT